MGSNRCSRRRVRAGGRLAVLGVAMVGVLGVATPVAAPAQVGDRQIYEAQLTSQAPASVTGLRQRITYLNPDDANGKPPAVAHVVFRLPQGARVDTTVPGQCGASELEFQLQGTEACPAASRVGSGALSADTGVAAGPFPRLIQTAVTFFNNRDELILFAQSTNTPGPPIRVVSRIEVRDGTFISSVPPLPGAPPPDPFIALKDVFNELDALEITRDGGSAAYLTTPETCPASGRWTITAAFTYRDGVKQTEQSTTPCAPARVEDGEQGQKQQEHGRGKGDGRAPERQKRGSVSDTIPVGGVEAGMGGSALSLMFGPGPLLSR